MLICLNQSQFFGLYVPQIKEENFMPEKKQRWTFILFLNIIKIIN